jgi:hypothetical protein
MNWVTDTVIFVLVLILLFVTWPLLFGERDDDDDL